MLFGMWFKVLGPVSVETDSATLNLGGHKQRTVLAVLVASAGERVSAEGLVGAVYGEEAHDRARRTVQTYVSNLRGVMGDVIEAQAGGWRLVPGDHELDARLFEELYRSAIEEDANAGDRSEILQSALDLWRGQPYEDVDAHGVLEAEVVRLQEMRAAALAARIEADLQMGRHDELIGELEVLIAEHPYNERFRGQHMLALYRAGRQKDALDSYNRMRGILVEGLGVDPSRQLQDLEQEILTQSESLDLFAGDRMGRPEGVDNAPHTLPVQQTSFVGRDQELAEVEKLVRGARLVTLTGAGGSGKTRLALQAASQVGEEFPDGVWVAELASLEDPSLVDDTVLTAAGLFQRPGTEPRELLRDHLSGKRSFLVVDNCEHLIAAVTDLISDLLASTTEVRFLATSRESLGVSGEAVFTVAPMAVPGAEMSERSQVVRFDALKLFEERGQLARSDFRITDANAEAVADICRGLDGLPLALELAAARLKTFTAEQLAESLGEGFHVLTGGNRAALPRHQALEATMDWSYRLLHEPEQRLLRRLSVFRGGFNLDAIRQVCTDDRLEASSILELLPSLVDKSLVVADLHGDEARYRLLETVRQYAANRLSAEAEEATFKEHHGGYFAEVAELYHDHPYDEADWLALFLVDNHDNLRQALSFYLENAPQKGLAMAGALRGFWLEHDHVAEGRNWLRRFLDAASEATPARARALMTLAILSEQNNRALPLMREALDLYRRLGPEHELAACFNNLGVLFDQTGRWEEAASLYRESLQRATPHHRIPPAAHNLADIIASIEKDPERAEALVGKSVDEARRANSPWWLAAARANMAYVRQLGGDIEGAGAAAHEALRLAAEVPDMYMATTTKQGAHGVLADLARQADDLTEAIDHTIQALETLQSQSEHLASFLGWHTSTHLIRWAGIQLARNNPAQAATVLGAVGAAADRQGYVFYPDVQKSQVQSLDAVRSKLSPDDHATAWNRGAKMTLQQASDYAVDQTRLRAAPRHDGGYPD